MSLLLRTLFIFATILVPSVIGQDNDLKDVIMEDTSTITDYDQIDLEVLSRERRALSFYRTGDKLQSEMSKTLNQLLGSNYNKRIRPNYGGPPVAVELNLSIRSIVRIA